MSSDPLEQMMHSLRPVASSSAKAGTGACSMVSVIGVSLHTANRLGEPGHVGHLLCRLLGEQGKHVLGRRAAVGGHPAKGRCRPGGVEVVASESDRRPMRLCQGDADVGGL